MEAFEISFRALSTEIYGSLISFQLCSNMHFLLKVRFYPRQRFSQLLDDKISLKCFSCASRSGGFFQSRKFIARDSHLDNDVSLLLIS